MSRGAPAQDVLCGWQRSLRWRTSWGWCPPRAAGGRLR
ncbi:MAG: hypothetical protein JWL68_6705 [Actinomycetia bacterium]|nr:hypothetical protein [Actinomycetes bacterium]